MTLLVFIHACMSMNKTMFVKPVNADGVKAKVACMDKGKSSCIQIV